MGKLRVYWLKTLKKLSIYPLGNTPSAPSVWIKVVMSELTTSHPTDGMDEIATIKVFEPVLIRVVCVGMAVEIHCRGVLSAVLVTSIL